MSFLFKTMSEFYRHLTKKTLLIETAGDARLNMTHTVIFEKVCPIRKRGSFKLANEQ
jgi:hypothetical protein